MFKIYKNIRRRIMKVICNDEEIEKVLKVKLIQDKDGVRLIQDGGYGFNILKINNKGKLVLHSNISSSIGLSLDSSGKIEIDHSLS